MDECPRCGETLDKDSDGDTYTYAEDGLCGDCFHEQYEFDCCGCNESGHIDVQHSFCVVFDKEAGVGPGLYRVTRNPYYFSDMLGGGLFPHALELLLTLPVRWLAYTSITGQKVYYKLIESDQSYPVGHLCEQCQRKILKPLKQLMEHVGS